MKNKTKKIIKRFFAWLYVGAMSIPLVCGIYNFAKEYHDVNAFNNATNSLLSSDDVNNVYDNRLLLGVDKLSNSSQIINGDTYLYKYVNNGIGTVSCRIGFSAVSFDFSEKFPNLPSHNYVAFLIYSANCDLIWYYDDGNGLQTLYSGVLKFDFYFVADTQYTLTSNPFTNFEIYHNVYVYESTASDVPSQVEKIVDYNLIVQKIIDDTSLSGFTDLIDIDFMGLFGGVHNTPTWDFVNYYINYLLNMSLILFMPEILMLFICWCRDLIYSMTDKEGGF